MYFYHISEAFFAQDINHAASYRVLAYQTALLSRCFSPAWCRKGLADVWEAVVGGHRFHVDWSSIHSLGLLQGRRRGLSWWWRTRRAFPDGFKELVESYIKMGILYVRIIVIRSNSMGFSVAFVSELSPQSLDPLKAYVLRLKFSWQREGHHEACGLSCEMPRLVHSLNTTALRSP